MMNLIAVVGLGVVLGIVLAVYILNLYNPHDQEEHMAGAVGGLSGGDFIEATPKKTRQGRGKHTKYTASSRNRAKKKYRGQGK